MGQDGKYGKFSKEFRASAHRRLAVTSALGYRTPEEFEAACALQTASVHEFEHLRLIQQIVRRRS
jgi:hypothetical protein